MKKTMILCCASLFALSVPAVEFYKLDLTNLAGGSALVKTDPAGKQQSLRPTWGLWPRTPDAVGVKVVERDNVKALEVQKGFQINTGEWDAKNNDAQQSVIYCRFRFLVPVATGKGLLGSLRLQQLNNRTAAFIGFEGRNGKIDVLAANGPGDGKVNWDKVAAVEPGKWFTVDVKLDFNEKKYDLSVNGGEWAAGKNFRHAAQWVGTMWAQDPGKKDYRYDVEASAATEIFFADAAFSADPFPEAAK